MAAPLALRTKMREREAKSLNGPPRARASITVVPLLSSYRPGFLISPTTEKLRLRISRTMTETSGEGIYSASFFVRSSRSCIGLRPATCKSLSSGSEILPSGRTGTARLRAALSDTAMSRTSSGPILYSPSTPAAAASPVRTNDATRTTVTTDRRITIMFIPRAGLRRYHPGAVHVRGHAPPQKVDRHDQQAPVRFGANENALQVRQRPAGDPNPLAFAQVGIGEGGYPGIEDPPDCFDLRVGNRRKSIPALAEDLHQSSRFQDLDVARLVQRAAEEDVARKHRNADEVPEPAAPRPLVDLRQEQVESHRRQLVVDPLLAVAPRPQGVPHRRRRGARESAVADGRVVGRSNQLDHRRAVHRMGFAPFGSIRPYGVEPHRPPFVISRGRFPPSGVDRYSAVTLFARFLAGSTSQSTRPGDVLGSAFTLRCPWTTLNSGNP